VTPPRTEQLCKLGRELSDEFRLRVVFPVIDFVKWLGGQLADVVRALAQHVRALADELQPVPAPPRFLEYAVALGTFVLHDRLTGRAFVFDAGELEDVAGTLKLYPSAYVDSAEAHRYLDVLTAEAARVVLPEVRLPGHL